MYYYLNYFFLFSIIGHFLESTLYPSYESGILTGYWTPIYGIGIVIIIFIYQLCQRWKLSNKWYFPLLFFLICGITLASIELLGGYLIQILFHRVFWNYQSHHFPIFLYTSLDMALIWGIASLGVSYLLKPLFDRIILKIPKWMTWIVSVIFIVDVLYQLSSLFTK
ncbi:MAG: hypothetical protein PUB18_02325 [bacterium]|nr:hypothetical protein [bacterium]